MAVVPWWRWWSEQSGAGGRARLVRLQPEVPPVRRSGWAGARLSDCQRAPVNTSGDSISWPRAQTGNRLCLSHVYIDTASVGHLLWKLKLCNQRLLAAQGGENKPGRVIAEKDREGEH